MWRRRQIRQKAQTLLVEVGKLLFLILGVLQRQKRIGVDRQQPTHHRETGYLDLQFSLIIVELSLTHGSNLLNLPLETNAIQNYATETPRKKLFLLCKEYVEHLSDENSYCPRADVSNLIIRIEYLPSHF